MKCGSCDVATRAGCSYDVAQLKCQVTGDPVGFYDECDLTQRQKLIWLLSDMSLDTPSDVEYVVDWLLLNGVSIS